MILAAGLTPAWQQILVFDRLELGEVNRSRTALACASGKVLNVGRACHALEAATLALAPVGGPSGEAIIREFAQANCPASWVQTSATTRTCTTLIDRSSNVVTELVENAAPLSSAELADFVSRYSAAAATAELVVLTGSLPPATPSSFYAQLLERTCGRTLLDVRGPELLAALPRRPWLVKPNRAELEHTWGRSLADERALRAAMRDLNHQGAEWVLVTQGPGPLWLSSATQCFRFDPVPNPRPVNPIGCGDCLAAGIAVGMVRGEPLPDSVALGIAAAAANADDLLPARLAPRDVAERRRTAAIQPLAASCRLDDVS